ATAPTDHAAARRAIRGAGPPAGSVSRCRAGRARRVEHLARDPSPGPAGDRPLGAGPGRFRVPAEEPGGQEVRALALCFPGVAARASTDGLGERALRDARRLVRDFQVDLAVREVGDPGRHWVERLPCATTSRPPFAKGPPGPGAAVRLGFSRGVRLL